MSKNIVAVGFATFVIVSLVTAQPPEFPQPQKEHAWMKQFVGEWDSEGEAMMGPDKWIKSKGSMNSRMLGGFWLVSDIKAESEGATTLGLFTMGYDPKTKKYIGTWVDSMLDHMWKYDGTLDATGKIITLEAEGPHFGKPGQTTKYRDIYEFKSSDQIDMHTVMLDDGKWNKIMKAKMTRKKK